MKIIIETPTLEDSEKVFKCMKTICIENFQEFEIKIGDMGFKLEKQEAKK
jgi:hypothetical protein